ncbi:MAG: glycine zipper 2TM domain-containing protein, partial [Burkholderiales bacterium]|nr:glycine zipper 2TM domain-containing protein [Burkholderiales bacterium]
YGNAPVPAVQAPAAKPVCGNCGVVEAVIETEKPGDGSGIGMAGGALGGAVVGKQFGKGRGQDFMTILGALGGAYAGHQVEKNVRATKSYEVRVRMEDGSVRSITQSAPPAWRNGDRVRVDGSAISLSYS